LFTAPAGVDMAAISGGTKLTKIGSVLAGAGVHLLQNGVDIAPERLGWEHQD